MNRTLSVGTDDQIIVIGSGPCGAMAAGRLVRRGLSVTMLDAGLEAPKGVIIRAAGNTLYRKMDLSQLESDRHERSLEAEVDWYSSRTLGGLSNYWTAAVPRFAPEDFTEGGRLDERYRWPITYDELVPFYEEAEASLVVTAGTSLANLPANVARFRVELAEDWRVFVASAARHSDFAGPMPMAKGRPWMAARRGTEFSSYHCVIAPLLASRQLNLISGASVTRLNWSSTDQRVTSVEYVDRRSGVRTTVHGQAVVVAAGVIDSTAILLRSVSPDFPDGLGNTNGIIGRYLHDHPREWWTAAPSHPMSALAHPVYISRAAYADSAPLMATSFTLGLAARTDRLRTFIRGKSQRFGVQVFGTMVPRPDVGVSLPKDLTPDTIYYRPKITLRYDEATIANLVSARSRLAEIFREAGSKVTLPGPFLAGAPGSSVHYGGSIRMHASPQFGALDQWNRLRDVPNVVVCDSSCFTTGPEKNPTLTAMAIAARATERLADDVLGRRVRPDSLRVVCPQMGPSVV